MLFSVTIQYILLFRQMKWQNMTWNELGMMMATTTTGGPIMDTLLRWTERSYCVDEESTRNKQRESHQLLFYE